MNPLRTQLAVGRTRPPLAPLGARERAAELERVHKCTYALDLVSDVDSYSVWRPSKSRHPTLSSAAKLLSSPARESGSRPPPRPSLFA